MAVMGQPNFYAYSPKTVFADSENRLKPIQLLKEQLNA